jgi:hypothetical protein
MLKLFHRTDHGEAILREGFRDMTGTYATDTELTGVWFSDVPLNVLDQIHGKDLLEITLDLQETDIADYECVSDPIPDPDTGEMVNPARYREWIIPASLVNEKGRLRVVDEDEEEDEE